MAYAPQAVIERPARLPLPFGLFSVVSLAESATERWESGVTWEALTCDPVAIVVGDCEAPEGFPKQFPVDGPGVGEASAFTVYGTYRCNPIGQTLDNAGAQAREVLLAREQEAVEGRLWATFDDAPDVLAGGDPVIAVGNLEQWIAENYGALGVIHASRNAVTTLIVNDLVSRHNGRLETELGTPVVAGGGYPGTGLAGAVPAAGTENIAITPALFGYRSEVFEGSNRLGDLLDTGTNDLYGIAERNYLIGYDPCGVAFAPITLGG